VKEFERRVALENRRNAHLQRDEIINVTYIDLFQTQNAFEPFPEKLIESLKIRIFNRHGSDCDERENPPRLEESSRRTTKRF